VIVYLPADLKADFCRYWVEKILIMSLRSQQLERHHVITWRGINGICYGLRIENLDFIFVVMTGK
jgi:hypothetical protein